VYKSDPTTRPYKQSSSNYEWESVGGNISVFKEPAKQFESSSNPREMEAERPKPARRLNSRRRIPPRPPKKPRGVYSRQQCNDPPPVIQKNVMEASLPPRKQMDRVRAPAKRNPTGPSPPPGRRYGRSDSSEKLRRRGPSPPPRLARELPHSPEKIRRTGPSPPPGYQRRRRDASSPPMNPPRRSQEKRTRPFESPSERYVPRTKRPRAPEPPARPSSPSPEQQMSPKRQQYTYNEDEGKWKKIDPHSNRDTGKIDSEQKMKQRDPPYGHFTGTRNSNPKFKARKNDGIVGSLADFDTGSSPSLSPERSHSPPLRRRRRFTPSPENISPVRRKYIPLSRRDTVSDSPKSFSARPGLKSTSSHEQDGSSSHEKHIPQKKQLSPPRKVNPPRKLNPHKLTLKKKPSPSPISQPKHEHARMKKSMIKSDAEIVNVEPHYKDRAEWQPYLVHKGWKYYGDYVSSKSKAGKMANWIFDKYGPLGEELPNPHLGIAVPRKLTRTSYLHNPDGKSDGEFIHHNPRQNLYGGPILLISIEAFKELSTLTADLRERCKNVIVICNIISGKDRAILHFNGKRRSKNLAIEFVLKHLIEKNVMEETEIEMLVPKATGRQVKPKKDWIREKEEINNYFPHFVKIKLRRRSGRSKPWKLVTSLARRKAIYCVHMDDDLDYYGL